MNSPGGWSLRAFKQLQQALRNPAQHAAMVRSARF